MAKKRQLAVIYIDSNKIQFYARDLKNILEIPLSSDIISDLEIVDTEKLGEIISSFFLSNNLKEQEFDVILVFSPSTTFEKELEEGDSKFKYDETQKFLDMVPFEDMLSNSYKIGKKTKIVAVNKSLYDNLRSNFEKNKAYILLVVPMSVLTESYPSLSSNLDLSFIASKIESIKQFSLIGFNESGLEGEIKNSMGIKKKDRRLYMLIGVLVVLFLVLIYMVYSTFLSPKPKTIKNLPVKKLLISPTPSPSVATSSSLLESTPSSKLR